MYTSQFTAVSITNATQDIWEMVAGAGVSVIVHWISLTVEPVITSGVAQDVRARLQLVERSTTGSGGTGVTPVGGHPRNSVAAATTTTRLVTTPGTIGEIRWSESVSIIVPGEKIWTPDVRQPISGGGRLCLFLQTALGAAFNASSTICFEEI
jgi:hypothetical protein